MEKEKLEYKIVSINSGYEHKSTGNFIEKSTINHIFIAVENSEYNEDTDYENNDIDEKDLERQFSNLPHELAFEIKSSSEFLKIACLNEKDYQKILEETTKSLKLKYQEKEFNLKTQIDNINQKNDALNYFLANANQVEYKK